MLETLQTQVSLGNDRKDDNNSTNNKIENIVLEHTIYNKNKQYSNGQVHQNSNRPLMDNGSKIMIVNNPKLLGKSYHLHYWAFEYRKPRSVELKQTKPRSEEFIPEVGAPLF